MSQKPLLTTDPGNHRPPGPPEEGVQVSALMSVERHRGVSKTPRADSKQGGSESWGCGEKGEVYLL